MAVDSANIVPQSKGDNGISAHTAQQSLPTMFVLHGTLQSP
jgi:hypothetical protein